MDPWLEGGNATIDWLKSTFSSHCALDKKLFGVASAVARLTLLPPPFRTRQTTARVNLSGFTLIPFTWLLVTLA